MEKVDNLKEQIYSVESDLEAKVRRAERTITRQVREGATVESYKKSSVLPVVVCIGGIIGFSLAILNIPDGFPLEVVWGVGGVAAVTGAIVSWGVLALFVNTPILFRNAGKKNAVEREIKTLHGIFSPMRKMLDESQAYRKEVNLFKESRYSLQQFTSQMIIDALRDQFANRGEQILAKLQEAMSFMKKLEDILEAAATLQRLSGLSDKNDPAFEKTVDLAKYIGEAGIVRGIEDWCVEHSLPVKYLIPEACRRR
jgi:hypothetical protein